MCSQSGAIYGRLYMLSLGYWRGNIRGIIPSVGLAGHPYPLLMCVFIVRGNNVGAWPHFKASETLRSRIVLYNSYMYRLCGGCEAVSVEFREVPGLVGEEGGPLRADTLYIPCRL